MHAILRKRLMRKLEVLPEDQLYQVLDYIEFLESKYAREHAPEPGGLQGFAERLEDRLRARSVVPSMMSGTMRMFGAAGRLVDEVSEAGRGVVEGVGSGLAEVSRPTATGSRGARGSDARSRGPGTRSPAGNSPAGKRRAPEPLVVPVDGPETSSNADSPSSKSAPGRKTDSPPDRPPPPRPAS